MDKIIGLVFAVDFDGTIVEHKYPNIGDPVPGALESLKQYIDAGINIVLNTMRSGKELRDAVKFLTDNEVKLYGVNRNPDQSWTTSPKVYGHYYIDDAAIGTPIIVPPDFDSRPYVDWSEMNKILRKRLKIEHGVEF